MLCSTMVGIYNGWYGPTIPWLTKRGRSLLWRAPVEAFCVCRNFPIFFEVLFVACALIYVCTHGTVVLRFLNRFRDPESAAVDTAAAIRRMKEARSRAVKGGGVKEVKSLAALQKELKVQPVLEIHRSDSHVKMYIFQGKIYSWSVRSSSSLQGGSRVILHGLGHVSWVGSVLYRSRTAPYPNGRLGYTSK